MVQVNDEKKKCHIWIMSENKNYEQSEEYQKTLLEYRNKKYSICTYIGGDKPLIPMIIALLKAQ